MTVGLTADLRRLAGPLGLALVIMVIGQAVAVSLIDPAFMYPRMHSDQLNYYLMAERFVEYGDFQARAAENGPAVQYVFMPSLLFSPLFLLVEDFDLRLRLIQGSNIGLMVVAAVLQSLLLYRYLPGPERVRRWLAPVPVVYLLVQAHWLRALLLPMSDILYVVFSMAAILAVRGTDWTPPLTASHLRRGLVFLVLAAIAFSVKIMAAFLIVFPLLLMPWKDPYFRRQPVVWGILGAACVISVVTLWVMWPVVLFYVFHGEDITVGPDAFAQPFDWVVSFVLSSLPTQIVPNFSYLYASSFTDPAHFIKVANLDGSAAPFLVAGGLISVVVAWGGWRCRRRMAPEGAYVVAVALLVMPVINGTSRYLCYLEPFLLAFLAHGLLAFLGPFGSRKVRRAGFWGAGCLLMVGLTVAASRYLQVESRYMETAAGYFQGTLTYVREVTAVYTRQRDALRQLPEGSRLVTDGPSGEWRAVLGIPYYRPDDNLAERVAEDRLYVVIDCERKFCGDVQARLLNLATRLKEAAPLCLEPIRREVTPVAEAHILRVRPPRSCRHPEANIPASFPAISPGVATQIIG